MKKKTLKKLNLKKGVVSKLRTTEILGGVTGGHQCNTGPRCTDRCKPPTG